MKENTLPKVLQESVVKLTEEMVDTLGSNLYSCILYGSAVRGDFAARSSDINLLILLNESTPQAHDLIATVMAAHQDIHVDPMVMGRAGMKRNFEMFGPKFVSIERDYRILHGSDPFKGLQIDTDHQKFLAEQSLRDLRIRAVRAYVLYSRDRSQYIRFINRMKAPIFIALSDVIRLSGSTEIPHDFADRPELIEGFFKTDSTVLQDFLQLGGREKLSIQEIQSLHLGLFNLLNHAIFWIESHWNDKSPLD